MQRPLCPGGRALEQWLNEHDRSQTWLADKIGVARSVLWRWLVGETTPTVDNAAAIERLTNIPASTWATEPKLRPRRTGTEG